MTAFDGPNSLKRDQWLEIIHEATRFHRGHQRHPDAHMVPDPPEVPSLITSNGYPATARSYLIHNPVTLGKPTKWMSATSPPTHSPHGNSEREVLT